MRRIVSLLACVAGAALMLVTCIGSASAHRTDCPASNPPNELVVEGGSGQTAQFGKPFPRNLQAKLANRNGCPLTGNLAGIDVDFSAPGSGPSGTFAGTGSRQTTVGTDSQGVATAPAFMANDSAGSYTVDARSDYGRVEFYLSNTANGVPGAISAAGGSDQGAPVNGEYPEPLQARVTDANGNPVPGEDVTFSVSAGSTGASATFLGKAETTATTNADGLAMSPPLLANGNPGRFTAFASVEGLATVAVYTLDNHAAADELTALPRARQSATVDAPYAAPLIARLTDSTGQAIEGAAVTFTLGGQDAINNLTAVNTPGAIFASGTDQAIALTDANGIATSPVFTANGTTGIFVATATTASASPLTFALRNLPAQVSLLIKSSSATVKKRYRAPLAANVRDRSGRPIRGASVIFTVSVSSGASATFPDGSRQATAVTGAGGRAIAPPLLANTRAGAFSVAAGVSGSTNPARGRLRNLAGRPTTITVGAASGEATPASTRFPVRLAVTVLDSYGNRVPGTTVKFSAPSAGASGSFTVVRQRRERRRKVTTASTARSVRVKTDAKGIAIAPPFTANTVVGGYLISAAVPGTKAHTVFALVNTPRQ